MQIELENSIVRSIDTPISSYSFRLAKLCSISMKPYSLCVIRKDQYVNTS